MPKSPYIVRNDRLSDVISAIQTLGTYRFYKLGVDSWSERICGDSAEAEKWSLIFKEHPEFFRFSSDGSKASLVLRRQKPKLFDVDTLEFVTREERDGRAADGQRRITRAPLSENDLKMLIDVAISLHSKALEDKRDGRWWISMLTTVGVALIGLIGVWLGAQLSP